MKKMISLIMAVLMLAIIFSGCGGPAAKEGAAENDAAGAPNNSSGGTVADSYSAYTEAKNAVITKISDGITNNPDTAMAALSFLGVSMIDLAILPISLFGQDQQAVEMGLAMMGAADVKYSENGNSYSVTYSDEDGKAYMFSGTYDPAADALTCTATTDGKESIYTEYRKTAFGYVGQYYFLNDDGTTSIYMIAVDGENGTIGISTTPGKSAALTGSESADFPKACNEWYSVTGTTITGKTSEGEDLNFEYTPTESAAS